MASIEDRLAKLEARMEYVERMVSAGDGLRTLAPPIGQDLGKVAEELRGLSQSIYLTRQDMSWMHQDMTQIRQDVAGLSQAIKGGLMSWIPDRTEGPPADGEH